MEKRIIMITGGQRSGKSELSENLALAADPCPVYLATAEVLDDEFRERVALHRRRRGPQWSAIEEPLYLSRHDVEGNAVVIDCMTMWATKAFFTFGEDPARALDFLKEEFMRFTAREAVFIFVTNELGSGGIGADAMTRKFTDLQGWFNQFVASEADDVYLTVAGIPLKIK